MEINEHGSPDIAERLAALIGALSGIFAGSLQEALVENDNIDDMQREALFNAVQAKYLGALDELEARLDAHYNEATDGKKHAEALPRHYGMKAETAVFSDHDWTHTVLKEEAPSGGQ